MLCCPPALNGRKEITMHFRSMLFVDLPETKPDPEWEKQVLLQMEQMKANNPAKIMESALFGLYLSRVVNVQTSFGRELVPVVDQAMERFYCDTRDPRYIEFEDKTEAYRTDYEKKVDCVVMPDGTIRELDSYRIWNKFIIKDGLVYQKVAGQLKHPKRTKKAKKMKALPGYPRKKLYASFEEFVEDWGGCKNEETGQYGEWYNPDSTYDWYQIGGRWPEMFLVKTDCVEFSYGERESMDDADYPAPEGYRWVACARKKDIQWEAMRQWRNRQAEERFHELEDMYQAGGRPNSYLKWTEEGLSRWGEQVYRKGQTLDEFLEKHGFPASRKYPISVCGIFIDETYHNEYDSTYDEELRKWIHLNWDEATDMHIDDADGDTVFVGIDYHM